MKKNIMLLAAGALLLMGGCSKSEIDEGSINSTSAISFSASSNRVTKAPAVTNDNATDYNFGVFAYYTKDVAWATYAATASTTPNFMNNEEVSYSDGYGWTYDPVKYWPNTSGEMISFFGYMPYSDATSASIGTGGVPTIVFTQTMDAEKMEDLVVAKALDQTKTTSAVVLPFDHVLSRLNFAAKVDHDLVEDDRSSYSTKVFVKGLRIMGTAANNAGDVVVSTDAVGENTASKFYNTASYIMSADTDDNGAWDYTATTTPQEVALDATAILNTSTQSFGAKNPAYSTESVAINQAGSSTSLLTSGEYLFLIPPSENGVESATDVLIQVDYDIVTADDKVTAGYTLSSTTATLSMPNGTLKEGVAYNVVMTIGLTEVTLSAEPTDWSDTEEEVEAIPTEVTVYSETSINSAITDAIAAGVDALTINYEGNEGELAIDFSSVTEASAMDLIINLPNQTEDVEIIVPENYTGSITIYAPDATVTAASATTSTGVIYTDVTVTTAQNTFIIPAGVTVENLTILAGNVEVSGVLKGTIYAGANLEKSIITVMSGGDVSGATINSGDESKITINDVPTAEGVYYSLDGGAWTKYSATTDIDGTTSYSAIKLITVGSTTTISTTHTTAIFSNNALKSADLSGATFNNAYVLWGNAPTNTQLEEFYYPENSITISGTLAGVTTLKKIVLPDCTEMIAGTMFNGCTSLTSINLENVKIIQNSVFQGCTSLESVDLSSLVNTAQLNNSSGELTDYTTSSSTFQDCTSLKDVTLGEELTEIPTSFFQSCTSLKYIDLTHVKTIANYSFRYSGLESVTLGEGLESLNTYAFQYTALKEVTIPSTVTFIGVDQFSYTNLESITFADRSSNNTPIEIKGYLARETNLSSFKFPDNCGTLGSHLLFNTPELKTVDFNGVTDLPRACFYQSGLESLYIPNYIDLNSKASDDGYTFIVMPNLKEFEIEEGGTAFTTRNKILYGNPVLETVTFPSTLLGFSGITMANCPMLSTIVCKATTVPTTTETDFGYINTDGSNYYTGCSVTGDKILYVPDGCKEAYESPTMSDNVTENYWKTVLIDICGFVVVELDGVATNSITLGTQEMQNGGNVNIN